MAFDRVHRLIDRLGSLPGIQDLRRAAFARHFRRGMGHAFCGRFDTFAEAAANVPTGLPPSYDNPAAAGMYVDAIQVDHHDYPSLFWLQHALLAGHRRIVDLGGSTGIKFYAFRPLLDLPAEALWRVIDVPAVAPLGRELAVRRGAGPALEFSSELADADGCDVLFASGSLQYLPQSLGEMLAGWQRPPARIVVNTTPIHPSRSFFTLNSIGTACCPYRVTAHDEFVEQVVRRGYRLRAEWRNLGKRLDLPYEPGLSLQHYSGFCFDREPAVRSGPPQ